MQKHVTLSPAYGRDYKSAKAVKADYDAGKDFILNAFGCRWNGKPINKEQCLAEGYCVTFRYANGRRVTQ
jgi:hypothetical protein